MAGPADFTSVALEALKPTGKLYEVSDGKTRGLRVAVQPSGAKSWIIRYRPKGSRANRKLTLGAYPAVGLKEARARANKALSIIAEGGDPAAEKRAKRQETKQQQAETIEVVVDQFVERYLKAKKLRTWAEVKRQLERNALTHWRGRPVSSITKKDIHAVLDDVMDRGASIAANRLFAALRKLFGWAVERGIISVSPCAGIKPPSSERSRDRLLDDDELARVWQACERLGGPFVPVIRMLILTGQRREEIGAMRWSEIDLDKRIWTIPVERAKNRAAHIVPLSGPALEILGAQKRLDCCDLVFSVTGSSPLSGYSKARERLDAVLAADGHPLPQWTLHDLRRSFASGCAGIGIALPVIERALNHISGSFRGVVGVYQKHEFLNERRAAMDGWARHIEAIVGDGTSNVVELAAVRS